MDATAALDFDRLYTEDAGRVYAFAYRMLADRDAALDVVQESFAIALANAGTFRGEASPLTWLTSIARNLCLKRARPGRELTFDDFEAAIRVHGHEPASLASDVERRSYIDEVKEGCLVGLLRCLPTNQRCAFVLHILNDLSIADVATVMAKSPNSVRILMSRARSNLRRFLCRNCALLGGSTCQCANMIDFSLARQLIEPHRAASDMERARDELRRFADEVELYRSLPEPTAAVAAAVASGRFAVFTGVKRSTSCEH